MPNELRTEVEQVKSTRMPGWMQSFVIWFILKKRTGQDEIDSVTQPEKQMNELFRKFAQRTSKMVGSSWAFEAATLG